MAIEKNIKINVDAEDAIKQVDTLEQGVEKTSTAAGKSKASFGKMKSGIGAVGTAFKALGVGLIVAAFAKLADMLGQNQAVMDKLSIAGEALNFMFQKVVQGAVKLGEKVTKAFSDPKQAIQDLWTALKENIVNRVEGVIDMFGALGKVIKGAFTRDMDLLKEGASQAGTAFIQIHTGLDKVQQSEVAETLKNTTKELVKSTKAAVDYGKAITNLRNEVKIAEAEQAKLQLTYQKDAELQRQIRDDISLTFEERIAANEELGRILDEQFEKEQALAQRKIDLAALELSQNKDNIDLQVALINAKTELADLDERITGQRSEQLTNLKALEKEQADAIQATIDAENKRLAAAQAAADKAVKIAEKEAKEKADLEKALAETRRSIVANSLGQISTLLGKESKAGKALAVGQALINTYQGATKALAQGGIFGAIGAAGVVAAGMASIKQIVSTKLPGAEGGGGAAAAAPTPSIPEAASVEELAEGFTLGSPNIEAIDQPTLGGGTQPAQAYVVENDISNAQALQQELDLQATL